MPKVEITIVCSTERPSKHEQLRLMSAAKTAKGQDKSLLSFAVEGLDCLPVCPNCTLQRAGLCRGSRDLFAWRQVVYSSSVG